MKLYSSDGLDRFGCGIVFGGLVIYETLQAVSPVGLPTGSGLTQALR